MPYFEFIWTDEIIEHIEEQEISQNDFEYVVCQPEQGTSRSSGRSVVWGRTPDGRFVVAFYELIDEMTVVPITAHEVHES